MESVGDSSGRGREKADCGRGFHAGRWILRGQGQTDSEEKSE